MSRLTVVVFRDGRTLLVVDEENLDPDTVRALSRAWEDSLASGLTIVTGASVQVIDADFSDGGIALRLVEP